MEEVILCIVANKIDLVDKRVVTNEEGQKFADEHDFIFQEISAKTGDGFSDLFYKQLFEKIRTKFRPSGQQPASEINDIKFNIFTQILITWSMSRMAMMISTASLPLVRMFFTPSLFTPYFFWFIFD